MAKRKAKATEPEPVKRGKGRPARPPIEGVRGRLGARLKSLRIAKGLKGEELAAAAGIAKSLLYNYEAGHYGASVDYLDRIAQALGVSLSDLFEGV